MVGEGRPAAGVSSHSLGSRQPATRPARHWLPVSLIQSTPSAHRDPAQVWHMGLMSGSCSGFPMSITGYQRGMYMWQVQSHLCPVPATCLSPSNLFLHNRAGHTLFAIHESSQNSKAVSKQSPVNEPLIFAYCKKKNIYIYTNNAKVIKTSSNPLHGINDC